jgi:nicotinamide-nucleotide adenylyltransferase
MKPYDLGLFVGRLQHIHAGHEHVINTALKVCDRLLILVGSAQEAGTIRNPFNVGTRIDMIREIYGSEVIVRALPDLTNEDDIGPHWGKFVLDHVRQAVRKLPEIMIYGNDEQRSGWFAPDDIKTITEMIVSRANLPISATMLRGFMAEDRYDDWARNVNPRLHKHYDKLRQELLSIDYYKEASR